MSTSTAKPARRRGSAAEEARLAIEQAEADGVKRAVMTLRMTLRDVSELKRDPKVPMADISYSPEGMRYLGVAVDQGGVTQSTLDRGDTSYVRGAAAAAPPVKPKATRKKAVKKEPVAKKEPAAKKEALAVEGGRLARKQSEERRARGVSLRPSPRLLKRPRCIILTSPMSSSRTASVTACLVLWAAVQLVVSRARACRPGADGVDPKKISRRPQSLQKSQLPAG